MNILIKVLKDFESTSELSKKKLDEVDYLRDRYYRFKIRGYSIYNINIVKGHIVWLYHNKKNARIKYYDLIVHYHEIRKYDKDKDKFRLYYGNLTTRFLR